MPGATMTYVLSYIMQNIPSEILQLAFKPRKYSTTVEQRIISEVIEGPILLDTNLVGGKRRDIFLRPDWIMDLNTNSEYSILGAGVESSYYLVPPEAREHRNISSVIGVAARMGSSLQGSGYSSNGVGGVGNTVSGMLVDMMNTRTFAQYPMAPQLTLEGTNIIKCNPERLMDEMAITVMLEYDSEFLNMNQSGIVAMQELCLCAVQRYIFTKLRVSIDESEVVGGMEIGVVKEIVVDYGQEAKRYKELLVKLKGAMMYDPRQLSRMIFHAL